MDNIEKQFIELSKEKEDFIKIQEFYNNLKTNDIIEDTQYQEHLDVAKWLLSLDQNINIHINDEEPFKFSCENGHLNVAQWLLSLNQNIDIHLLL